MNALQKPTDRLSRIMMDWLPDSLVDRGFFDLDPGALTTKFSANVPSANIRETLKDFILELAAPGLNRDDFRITLDEGALTISVEKEEEKEEKEKENDYTRKEYSYSSFLRCFTLPENIREGSIEAKYNNGILTVVIPKEMEETTRPVQTIQVK
jgi:HSP20 family protein